MTETTQTKLEFLQSELDTLPTDCDVPNDEIIQSNGHYFEGVEKLLEIWFSPCENPEADLRDLPRSIWEHLLKLVKCEIISFSKNECIDAYVLSESSMFVSKRRWILKTCGTTTPLACLKGALLLAEKIGFNEVSEMFYSRKNFSRPELQQFPHRGFCEEVQFLDTIFEDGRSYCLGSINRECWYLYTFSKYSQQNEQITSEDRDSGTDTDLETELTSNLNDNEMNSEQQSDPDQTVEVLMQDLDQDVMKLFTKEISKDGNDATVKSGINKIIPLMEIDDFLFDPCGYSMNGIGKAGEYMTIHITPEKTFSYVSFETNVALSNYTSLINRVVTTFKPAKFIVTIFANKTSSGYDTMKELDLEFTKIARWKRTDMQCCKFPSYNLLFAQYTQLS